MHKRRLTSKVKFSEIALIIEYIFCYDNRPQHLKSPRDTICIIKRKMNEVHLNEIKFKTRNFIQQCFHTASSMTKNIQAQIMQ